ncbi:MAG: hypothetical protein INF00_10540 [Phenylobacterium sp.]|jgi:hypothetical protein|uniref:hypothetical protein n=1 Tax=Phenylobacterium sp. TaxID=1871053 RepID=UPI0025FD671A|nr:hypothetical protein [Phenylobacterium sp.]MCA3713018.1 hypothetical protein [Phenylobacterium sp.]MCA3732788.1 hypothetical protein [Phenylobacterium sp.]MCA6239516.1 hypothetical protein [Phenylobacterium sp.]
MPSSYTSSFRLNIQAPGDNLNTWGTILNNGVFQLLEDALAGAVTQALSGSLTLSSVNGATDQARCLALNITSGTGGTITAPGVKKLYFVRNAASGAVIVTTGAGATASFAAGEVGFCYSPDGINFYRTTVTTAFGGAILTGVGTPSAATDAATKGYVDGVAFTMAAGALPGQGGNAGKALITDGTTASWGIPVLTTSNLTDYASDQAAKTATATKLAIAFAAAL